MASTPVQRSVMVDIVTSAGSTVSGGIHCRGCVLVVGVCWLWVCAGCE